MQNLSKEVLSGIGNHLITALKNQQQSQVRFTKFTVSPTPNDPTCQPGFHEEWVPVGNGSYELQCVPN
jgi:hypothetical protein